MAGIWKGPGGRRLDKNPVPGIDGDEVCTGGDGHKQKKEDVSERQEPAGLGGDYPTNSPTFQAGLCYKIQTPISLAWALAPSLPVYPVSSTLSLCGWLFP